MEEKKGRWWKLEIMTEKGATIVIASRLPERRQTEMPTAHAKLWNGTYHNLDFLRMQILLPIARFRVILEYFSIIIFKTEILQWYYKHIHIGKKYEPKIIRIHVRKNSPIKFIFVFGPEKNYSLRSALAFFFVSNRIRFSIFIVTNNTTKNNKNTTKDWGLKNRELGLKLSFSKLKTLDLSLVLFQTRWYSPHCPAPNCKCQGWSSSSLTWLWVEKILDIYIYKSYFM